MLTREERMFEDEPDSFMGRINSVVTRQVPMKKGVEGIVAAIVGIPCVLFRWLTLPSNSANFLQFFLCALIIFSFFSFRKVSILTRLLGLVLVLPIGLGGMFILIRGSVGEMMPFWICLFLLQFVVTSFEAGMRWWSLLFFVVALPFMFFSVVSVFLAFSLYGLVYMNPSNVSRIELSEINREVGSPPVVRVFDEEEDIRKIVRAFRNLCGFFEDGNEHRVEFWELMIVPVEGNLIRLNVGDSSLRPGRCWVRGDPIKYLYQCPALFDVLENDLQIEIPPKRNITIDP